MFRHHGVCGRYNRAWLNSTSFQCHSNRRYASSLSSTKPNDRLFLSTSVTKAFNIPLTLTDIHLRHEQLPFAYLFRQTLDRDRLISSLREVLQRYPQLGGCTDFSRGKVPTIECGIDDTLPLSFGQSELTLDDWLMQVKSGKIQHGNWTSGGGAPFLSPLFDDLSSIRWDSSNNQHYYTKEHISTVRITYFKGYGTAIGINISHLLGDANTCVRIAQVWGRAMRGLSHPTGASNARAEATLSGMVSPAMASILNLNVEKEKHWPFESSSFYDTISSYFDDIVSTEDVAKEKESAAAISNSHEYVRLEYSPQLLCAMKAYGMIYCNLQQQPTNHSPTFVSTNDMITAMGWLLKRQIAQRYDWNLSMVVNLRSRGNIDAFSCLKDSTVGTGVLGNALTSVIATLAPSIEGEITMDEVCSAATSIRSSLTNKLGDIEHLQSLSFLGKAAVKAFQGNCFSTTSWMQCSDEIWGIQFSNDVGSEGNNHLAGFYGRPSYALPVGDTFSSIAVPSRLGGCTYKMLAPTRHVQSILSLHRGLSRHFMDWSLCKE